MAKGRRFLHNSTPTEWTVMSAILIDDQHWSGITVRDEFDNFLEAIDTFCVFVYLLIT